jgi:radical SAM-linked protein
VKVRIRYSKLGKIRFTSHRDTANHWERALRRSGLRVALSNGFTPRPRLSFGLGLPTGAESHAEYLDIEFVEDHPIDEIVRLVDDGLPGGYAALGARHVERGAPSLQESVVAGSWSLGLRGVEADVLAARVEAFVAASSVTIRRSRKGHDSADDIRPAVESLTVAHASQVIETTLSTFDRGVRPAELVRALIPESDPLDLLAHVVRTHQWVLINGERSEPIAAAAPSFAAHSGAERTLYG